MAKIAKLEAMMAEKRELEAFASLGEVAMWVTALSSDAENLEEISNLRRVLSEELDYFLADSSQAVPLSARRALEALEQRASEL